VVQLGEIPAFEGIDHSRLSKDISKNYHLHQFAVFAVAGLQDKSKAVLNFWIEELQSEVIAFQKLASRVLCQMGFA
jgi:hypothetical protein